MKKPLIAPSVLASDFGRINEEIEMLNNSDADYIHVDIMDGVFVPNISFGIPVTKAMNKQARKPLDVHLMIVDPDRYISDFKAAGADVLTVHYEACTHLHRTVQAIRGEGMKAGVALNPHTPVHLLENIIEELDLVCIMSVNPGFGGQKFIENAYYKIARLREMINRSKSKALIEVDGGVGMGNAQKLVITGADVLVAGNAVFGSENPQQTIAALKAVE